MELGGYFMLGMFFLIFGVLLYIPGHWWAKRKLRNAPPGSEYRLHITSAGFALCALMVFALVLGFSQKYLAPQTEFGKFVSTGFGMLSYLLAVYAMTVVFGLIMEMLGFTLFRYSNGDE